jgi:hypothetical protein
MLTIRAGACSRGPVGARVLYLPLLFTGIGDTRFSFLRRSR